MSSSLTVAELMEQSGVKFGTSGARGLADAMTDRVCYAYARGFLRFLSARGDLARSGTEVAVGGDFRPSTDRVMAAVIRAITDLGYRVVNCGKVPSPAVALLGLERGIPAIMVTGSHIPDDRNGIKFNKPAGEILKDDEQGMMAQGLDLDETQFDSDGNFRGGPAGLPAADSTARDAYVARYTAAFAGRPLSGSRLGVYQHSAVGRDVIVEVLSALGADVVPLGRSERFIPVDTEAIRPEDIQLARDWARDGRFDALVSADGDSDRPLVSDERGEWLRGDVAGVLCARFLDADSVTTPVSSNTLVERCGWFGEVRRTRIGSPYVVASMLAAQRDGRRRVVGYEANGGFLIQSETAPMGRPLRALPTRDAVIVMLGVLLTSRREGRTISEMVAALPSRHTASDRLKEFPIEQSRAILERFSSPGAAQAHAELDRMFGSLTAGRAELIDRTDGVRVTFSNGEILHLRPSGNAPEFRCYTEAETSTRANDLCAGALRILRGLA